MQAQQKLFIIALAAAVTLTAALGVLLYVSLIPHFGDIGNVAFWVLVTFLGCGCALGINWTWNRIKINNAEAHNAQLRKGLITHGELAYHVFEAPMPPERIYDASARHVAAGVPRMLPAPADEKLESDDATILELYNDGQMTLEAIADTLHISYYRAQRVIAECKKKGLVNRR